MTENGDQISYWNEVAGEKWVANQILIDRLMEPLTERLVTVAAPRLGEKAVDVGCGCGDLALRLADRLGPGGRILAIDVSRPMLAHAEARFAVSEKRGCAIDWLVADAMTHPFERNTDLLMSRFGVMFFDDTPRAFANLRSSLRPGGRFALMTWRRRSDVEWMQAPLDWIAPVLPTPAETTGEIGPFALADADSTCRTLSNAGFCDVAADRVDCSLVVGMAGAGNGDRDGQAVEDAIVVLAGTGPAAALMRDAEPSLREQAMRLLRAGASRYVSEGRVMLNGACWIYRGINPETASRRL